MNKILPLICLCSIIVSACAKEEGTVIATVGKERITEESLREKLSEMGPVADGYFSTKPGRRQFLDLVIRERIMYQSAQKSGVALSPEYRDAIEQKKVEFDKMLSAYKEYTLSKMWLNEMFDTEFKVTDEEAREYYKNYPYIMTLGNILLPNNDKEAEAIYRRLKAGADFDALAKEYSVDKETIYLPPVMRGEYLPELDDMISKMKVGETQGIVRTALGLHIIKKISQERGKETEVLPRIKDILQKKKFDKYIENRTNTLNVEVLDERYK